jgi:hypothetical protein
MGISVIGLASLLVGQLRKGWQLDFADGARLAPR